MFRNSDNGSGVVEVVTIVGNDYASFGVDNNTTKNHINLPKQLLVNTQEIDIILTLLYFFSIVLNPLRQFFFSRRDFPHLPFTVYSPLSLFI